MHKISLLIILTSLCGCSTGPDYAGPPQVGTASRLNEFARMGTPIIAEEPSVAAWWKALGDSKLNMLVERVLAANPQISIAQARLEQAHAQLRYDKASGRPSIDASPRYLYAHVPKLNLGDESAASDDLEIYNLGFTAAWEIDLFGGQQRLREASRATMAAAQASLADVQVSLSAQTAQAYVNLRQQQRNVELLRKKLRIQQDMLQLMQQRFASGTISENVVQKTHVQVADVEASLLALDVETKASLNMLAILTGEKPGAVDAMLQQVEPVPVAPSIIPVGDIAGLISRRPDVRVAERTLAANSARVGATKAAALPHFSLLGIVGIGGSSLGDLTNLADITTLGAPSVKWNFLDFGRNRARLAKAEALRDEAAAQYRAVVLNAIGDAEESLSIFRYSREVVSVRVRTRDAMVRSVTLSSDRYRAGSASQIDVIEAELAHLVSEQAYMTAMANVTSAYIGLHKALGLGWGETSPSIADQSSISDAN